MIADIEFEAKGTFFIPFLFMFSSYIKYKEFLIFATLILAVLQSIIIWLFQYSIICKKTKDQDPFKTFGFSCIAMIIADIFFCIFIAFPFSFTILILNLK